MLEVVFVVVRVVVAVVVVFDDACGVVSGVDRLLELEADLLMDSVRERLTLEVGELDALRISVGKNTFSPFLLQNLIDTLRSSG